MEYAAIQVGTSPKTGLPVFRQYAGHRDILEQDEIIVWYNEWQVNLDGSKKYVPKKDYRVINVPDKVIPATFDDEGNEVTPEQIIPGKKEFDKWRTYDLTSLPTGTTFEQFIVGSVNLTLVDLNRLPITE